MRSLHLGLKSIRYHWKRSVLIGAVFLILMMLLELTVSLYQNVGTASKRLESDIGADLNLRKAEAVPFSYYSGNYFKLADAEDMLEIDGIESLEYMTLSNVSGVTVEGVFEEYRSMSQQAKEGRGEDYWGEYYDAEGLGEARTAGNITLVGVENLEDAWEFEKWKDQVVEGTGFSKADADRPVAVVSERFMRWNLLEVGQEITLGDPLDASREITLQVIGVHSGNMESELVAHSPMNFIYIPAKQGLLFSDGMVMEVKYHTTDPGNTKMLKQELETRMRQVTGEDFQATEEKLTYLMALSPLNTVRKVCLWMLGTIFTVSLFLLILLTGHQLLGRRTEIGLWIAMGERKRRVISQMAWELLLPALAGIAGSGLLTGIFEKSIGNAMTAYFPFFQGLFFQADMGVLLGGVLASAVLLPGIVLMTVCFMTRNNPKELL